MLLTTALPDLNTELVSPVISSTLVMSPPVILNVPSVRVPTVAVPDTFDKFENTFDHLFDVNPNEYVLVVSGLR